MKDKIRIPAPLLVYSDDDGHHVCFSYGEKNHRASLAHNIEEFEHARRICAAVNATANLKTEVLEAINHPGGHSLLDGASWKNEATIHAKLHLEAAAERDRLRQQNAELTELQTQAGQLAKEGVMQKNEEIERLRQQNAELVNVVRDLTEESDTIGIAEWQKRMDDARAALAEYDQPNQIWQRTYPKDSPELFISIHDIPEHLREQLQAHLSGTARKDDQPNTDKFPKSIYDAAPDMYKLLQDIAYPRRGSKAETWTIEPRAAQLAIRIIADIDSDQPAPMCENCGHDHHPGQPCNFEAEDDFPEKPTPTEIRSMNESIRLREIENFLECEGLTDEFEDWYLDKQFELGAKHEPQNPADLDEF